MLDVRAHLLSLSVYRHFYKVDNFMEIILNILKLFKNTIFGLLVNELFLTHTMFGLLFLLGHWHFEPQFRLPILSKSLAYR